MFFKMFFVLSLMVLGVMGCEEKSEATTSDSVILMIGDGMGKNHVLCAAKDKDLYLLTLPVRGMVKTRSADSKVTDSAASATAYACGNKTNNHMLGKLPNNRDCLTIAEECVKKGLNVGIYSTDYSTGATPSAFYAHVFHRKQAPLIEKYKERAKKKMDIEVPVEKISDIVSDRLNKLSALNKNFFAMFEGAKIDVASTANNLENMKQELYDFDLAIMKAVEFINENPNTTLIVLADHETGGLTEECVYTTKNHTGSDIPVYAYGKHADLFKGGQENTEIHDKIQKILFGKN